MSKDKFLPVYKPDLSGNELKYVSECITTEWISSLGSFVQQFEEMFADICDVKHAISLANGTVALYQEIHGTSRRIPEGERMWLIVYPHAVGRYYPQGDQSLPVIENNGNWSGSATFGLAEDAPGTGFDLLVVLADADAHCALNMYMVENAAKGEGWPGLLALPEGVTVYQRLRVSR